jgi:hypothetical protein
VFFLGDQCGGVRVGNETNKPVVLELGIEFIVELLLFLYPYGADQMGLPHNFWLGLGCWIVATIIAIRMFWIFPLWAKRLSPFGKGIIVVVCVALFISVFYKPVIEAHAKWKAEKLQATAAAQSQSTPKTQQHATKPQTTTTSSETKPRKKERPSEEKQVPSVSTSGSNSPAVGSITQGPGSVTQVGGGVNVATVVKPPTGNLSERALKLAETMRKDMEERDVAEWRQPEGAMTKHINDARYFRIRYLKDMIEIRDEFAELHIRDKRVDEFVRERQMRELSIIPQAADDWFLVSDIDDAADGLKRLAAQLKNP